MHRNTTQSTTKHTTTLGADEDLPRPSHREEVKRDNGEAWTPRRCLQEGHDTESRHRPIAEIKFSRGATWREENTTTEPSRRKRRPRRRHRRSEKTGQVMGSGVNPLPNHHASPNITNHATHVAMAARPHPRRALRPRTPRLPPPGPPPSIQATP